MKRLSMAEMDEMKKNKLAFYSRMAEEYGGVVHMKMLWLDFFLVSEPDVIRELLVKHAHQTHRDPFSTNVIRRILGEGVFIAEGKAWKRQRKMVQPAFHAMRIRAYTDTMAAYTREMISTWRSGQVKTVDQELTQLTLRIIAKTMYDVDLESQTAELGRLMKEILTVAEAQLHMLFVPPKWIPTRLNRRQARALTKVRALLRKIIRERQADGTDHGDLLSMLLDARDEDGNPMPEEQLLDECITLFVAGHETTAAALTWTWYLLAEHPEIAKRLYSEIDETLAGAPITFDKISELPLLDGVIKEALRLYPPAFGVGRTPIGTPTEAITVQGHTFPKKAIILISTFVTQRRADLFPEPLKFRPERFMDPENQPDRYAYIPFGAGPRVCLGNMFAIMEAAVILTTMMQHVDLTLTETKPVELDTLLTLRPRDPLMMRVTERGDHSTPKVEMGLKVVA